MRCWAARCFRTTWCPARQVELTVRVALPAGVGPGRFTLVVDLIDELVCWFSDLEPASASRHALEVRTGLAAQRGLQPHAVADATASGSTPARRLERTRPAGPRRASGWSPVRSGTANRHAVPGPPMSARPTTRLAAAARVIGPGGHSRGSRASSRCSAGGSSTSVARSPPTDADVHGMNACPGGRPSSGQGDVAGPAPGFEAGQCHQRRPQRLGRRAEQPAAIGALLDASRAPRAAVARRRRRRPAHLDSRHAPGPGAAGRPRRSTRRRAVRDGRRRSPPRRRPPRPGRRCPPPRSPRPRPAPPVGYRGLCRGRCRRRRRRS